MDIHSIPKTKAYLVVKRLGDILISLILLIPGIQLVIVFAFLIMMNDFGNPFIVQKRLGYHGKEFNLLKLRSMVLDAEKHGMQWAQKDDPRILKVGKFIRKTRIDELPQLLNILKGDMSFVGPRPERKELADIFAKEIPNFHDRLLVKPGLTGCAQVHGGYELTPEQKLVFDLCYIQHMSLRLDIDIILRTVAVVLTGAGAR